MTYVADTAIGAAPPTSLPARPGEASQPGHDDARAALEHFHARLGENFYLSNPELRHTVAFHIGDRLDSELASHGAAVAEAEPLVAANDERLNYPRLEPYDGVGRRVDRIDHHGNYAAVGDVIYGSGVVARLVEVGGLREGHAFNLLNCMLGEAGHNCPVICNFETARLLQRLDGLPQRDEWLAGLLEPSYTRNLTASQFLTEVTGGSDVGANATVAWRDDQGNWRIRGEKWFASNADADLNVITARFDPERPRTKGLSVFLVPARLPSGERNSYTLRRLKEKLGTRALATAEIDYHDAWAVPLTDHVERGFNTMMEDVVHHSRIAMGVSCLGLATRAYQIARIYADERTVFGRRVIEHPLAQENLADIRAHVTAMQAGVFRLIAMQDEVDTGADERSERVGFIRLMANVYKHVVSQAAVDHCHHALDTLGGNGAIETFSSIPRLLRDAIIEENWEGTHNTVRAQVLRDMLRYEVDAAYLAVMEEEVEHIPSLPEAAAARRALERLRDGFAKLRGADADAQPLIVQHQLHEMANLSAWVALLAEAEHQQRTEGVKTKAAAARYFQSRTLDGSAPTYDVAGRELIAAVVGAR